MIFIVSTTTHRQISPAREGNKTTLQEPTIETSS